MKSNVQIVPQRDEKSSQSNESRLKIAYKQGNLFSLVMKKMLSFFIIIIKNILKVNVKLDLSSILGDTTIHVIDVGAADGFNNRWNKFGKNLKIYLFEPEEEAFIALKKQYKDDIRVKVFNIALSEGGGIEPLYITAWPRASSMYKPDNDFIEKTFLRDHFKVIKSIAVETTKLIDVCKSADFIKLDVQGYELPILSGAGELVNSCIGMEIEVNFESYYLNCPLFGDVDSFCRNNGFNLVQLSPPGYWHYLLPDAKLEDKGFIIACDAYYFRLPHNVIELVYQKTWNKNKIAIAASIYLAFDKFEFAYILLEEAIKGQLLSKTDSLFESIMKLIYVRSGRSRLISYKLEQKIRGLYSSLFILSETLSFL